MNATRSTSTRIPPYRTLRELIGESLETTAERAEVDKAHLSRMERGLAEPGLLVFYRLITVLGQTELARMLKPYVEGNK